MHIKDNPDLYKQSTEDLAKAGELPIQLYAEWEKRLSGRLALEFLRNPIKFLQDRFGINVEKQPE